MLTKTEKRLYGKELEKYLERNMDKLSRRTFFRKMSYIKSIKENGYSFDYVASINNRNLGLMRVEIEYSKPIHRDISLIIPHNHYHLIALDNNLEKVQFTHYLIPPKHFDDFIELHENFKRIGLFQEYRFNIVVDAKYIPSQFHKIIKKDGSMKFDTQVDNSYFIQRITSSDHSIRTDPRIIQEPFMIPVLFENEKESFSAGEVFDKIVERHGEYVFEYVNSPDQKRDRDFKKLKKYVKKLISEMNNNFNTFHGSMYVHYHPFWECKEMCFLIIEFDMPTFSLEYLKIIVETTLKQSIMLTYYLFDKNFKSKGVKLLIHTNHSAAYNLLNYYKEIDSKMNYYYADIENHLGIMDREHAKYFYWETYDTGIKDWVFDDQEYLQKAIDLKTRIDEGTYEEKKPYSW